MRWIHERAGFLPAPLADDLARIDELATERGANLLVDVAHDAGVEIRGFAGSPLQTAVNAFLDHQTVFDRAFSRQAIEAVRGASEFTGRAGVPAERLEVPRLQALEAELGRFFDGRAKSGHCRVTVSTDVTRVMFTIAHGGLIRAEEALDDPAVLVDEPSLVREPSLVYLSERTLRYRPQRRDVVFFDKAADVLRVQAGEAATILAYRQAFGRLLHGDGEWFGDGPVVSLEPLVHIGRQIERPTPGLRTVRLVGLIVNYASYPGGKLAIDSVNIWPFLEQRVRHGLDQGSLVEATFRVSTIADKTDRLAWLRMPKKVEYGTVEERMFRPWLEARGLLSRPPRSSG